MDSPFDVLQIESDADEEDIDQAYRQRVKEAHPDQGGSSAEFQLVKEAYTVIKSGEQRDLGDDAPEERVDHYQREESRVEYLNYEVLDDHGWNLDDDDLFEKASAEDLDSVDHGWIIVQPDEFLLEAAENSGFAWPYACRGGACANCAVAVTDGEMTLPTDHILSSEMTDQGIRLSCNGSPITEEMQVVYNVKHRPDLNELRLPPYPFNLAHAND